MWLCMYELSRPVGERCRKDKNDEMWWWVVVIEVCVCWGRVSSLSVECCWKCEYECEGKGVREERGRREETGRGKVRACLDEWYENGIQKKFFCGFVGLGVEGG